MWVFLCSYFPSISSDLLLLHWNQCISCQLFEQPGALKFRVLILCVCVLSCGVHLFFFWHYYIPGYYPHWIPLRPTLLGYGKGNKTRVFLMELTINFFLVMSSHCWRAAGSLVGEFCEWYFHQRNKTVFSCTYWRIILLLH